MIEIHQLHHRYPDQTDALKGVDLTIADGEFLLICGPNASGKTTLIRHLNALLMPTSGWVRVNNLYTTRSASEIRRLVGMVFQDADTQIIGETVREDIAFGPENMGLPRKEVDSRVEWILDALGLTEYADKPCYLLSGGLKRRVAIAGVLAMKPNTLIFDEPFSNLDYTGIQETLRRIIELHREGRTIIITTHDVEKILAHVDRVVVLYDGQVKAQGCPADMIPTFARYGIRPPCYSLAGREQFTWLSE